VLGSVELVDVTLVMDLEELRLQHETPVSCLISLVVLLTT
jgi:hypothetical protein